MAITKVTEGVRTLGTGEVATANMATDPTNASNLASGTVGSARMGSGTASASTILYGDGSWKTEPAEYNDAALLNDIATLALQQATLNNQSAYNLANAFVDQYEDSTGIDVVTQCERSSGEYVSTIYTTAGNDSNTVLLLHCDGANDSTAIPDSATGGNAPHTLSMGAYIKTAQKKFGTASLYGDGSSYYVDIPENADFTWGSGSFTIDMWMRAASPTTSQRLWSDVQAGPTYGTYARPSGGFYVAGYNTAMSLDAFDSAPTADTWTHMAFEYDSGTGTARSYKDGVVQKTQTGLSGSATDVSQNPRIMRGNGDTTGQAYSGYLDEIRVSNIARYSGTGFTPVTQAYGSTATYGDGNYTSTTETSAATVSKMGIVVLYKNAYGTATLDTDLIAQVSADGGSNYTSAPLTAAGTFSTGINIAVSNDITISNTGTAPKYKISFDNQVQSSKETQVYGVALLY